MKRSIQKFYENAYLTADEIPRLSKQYTVEFVPQCGNLTILDVGCGSGINALALSARGHRIVGVDISEIAVEKFRDRGFEGCVADIESGFPFLDGYFDLVFCSEVVEHMTSPESLVAEMSRVLKPFGTIVLSTPNSAFWLYRLFSLFGYTLSEVQHPKHFHFFSRRSLLKLLRCHNFEPKVLAGANMYFLLPDLPKMFWPLLNALGFRRQIRFRTKKYFWHWSHKSSAFNSLFAETLIAVMQKN